MPMAYKARIHVSRSVIFISWIIWYIFLTFCSKQGLWVLVRAASRVPSLRFGSKFDKIIHTLINLPFPYIIWGLLRCSLQKLLKEMVPFGKLRILRSFVRTANALIRLLGITGLPEPLMVAYYEWSQWLVRLLLPTYSKVLLFFSFGANSWRWIVFRVVKIYKFKYI